MYKMKTRWQFLTAAIFLLLIIFMRAEFLEGDVPKM